MDDLAKRVEIILRQKETITTAVEKKTKGDLVVENRRLLDQLQSTLKQGQDANFFIIQHMFYVQGASPKQKAPTTLLQGSPPISHQGLGRALSS